MKNNYHRDIILRCDVCGHDDQFESNEDKSYVKCKACGKEYHGGFDELQELNAAFISDNIEDMKQEATPEIKKDLMASLKKALRGNKNIKFK
ncbi:MAG: hypothetical protein SNJ29_10005 [Rikenellaceae bacterium]